MTVRTFAILIFLIVAGCAGLRDHGPNGEVACPEAVVFVADGAGDFRAASTFLRNVLAHDGMPVQVKTVIWSHGYGRILCDQLDYAHGRNLGFNLAGTIMAYRKAHPDVKIYLVGHSAGSVVVMAAAESLPPDSIEGMALLSPSLSTFYDVRPALFAIRNHLDVYYSKHDCLYLGLGTGFWGTSDRLRAPASGRVGFQTYPESPEDQILYSRLRQHCWQPADWPTGNHGGHYGAYQPGFLRTRVLPALMAPAGQPLHEFLAPR